MNPKGALFRIQVLSRQKRYRIHRDSVASFCSDVLRSLGQSSRSLSIVFVTAREIRSLNCRYLQRNYATDVLSFSYGNVMVDSLPFLGEIIISPEAAVEEAYIVGTCPEKELKRLLVHGILHLLGYNHETDKGQMKRLQSNVLRRKFSSTAASLADLKVNR